jgi:hypothetical protein
MSIAIGRLAAALVTIMKGTADNKIPVVLKKFPTDIPLTCRYLGPPCTQPCHQGVSGSRPWSTAVASSRGQRQSAAASRGAAPVLSA